MRLPGRQNRPQKPAPAPAAAKETLPKGTYAVFDTSLGTFTARLFLDQTPVTAQNFIDLAEGKKEFRDPQTGKMVKHPLFDGHKIFRIIKGFMFQTGSPSDNNAYDAGFNIADEPRANLTFDKPGKLAMANTGRPNSGSTQFFVTTGPNWHDGDGGYTIFGEVVDAMDTVRKIESVKTEMNASGSEMSQPVEPPVIKKVTIKRVQ